MLQAGAQAVLATLWPVDDYATFILMVRFAQIWLPRMNDDPPAKALAQAQQWMRTITNKSLQTWHATTLQNFTLEEQRSVISEKEAWQEENVNRSVADLIASGMRSYRSEYNGDIEGAQEEVTKRARLGDPEAQPFADPIYWAGFQITGW
jgi:CHAT domain-containing protein